MMGNYPYLKTMQTKFVDIETGEELYACQSESVPFHGSKLALSLGRKKGTWRVKKSEESDGVVIITCKKISNDFEPSLNGISAISTGNG